MTLVPCTCCRALAEPHKTVNCAVCKKGYKIDCVDISNTEARKIHSNSGLSWSCNSCSQLGNDLVSFKAAFVALREEVMVLKESIAKTATPSLSLLETEKIIQEVADRDKRKSNVIIYGCDESNVKTNMEQVNLDTALVKEFLTTVEIDDPEFKVQRLGRFDLTSSSRRRPIKVQLSSTLSVAKLLKGSTKIKSVGRWRDVNFSPDRTNMQRELHRVMRQNLQDRLDSGEANLKLKYINGIPSIIQSEN